MKNRLSNFFVAQLIVWNVGQGQWVTEVSEKFCIHYDLGGEKDVSSSVIETCRGRRNLLHLSHWDWDHISFAAKFAAKSLNACLIARPQGPAPEWKRRQIERIPLCEENPLQTSLYTPNPRNSQSRRFSSNDFSEVFWSPKWGALFPGDSPSSQEKQWIPRLPRSKIHGLVLGHHGSRTSTSEELIRALPNLRWAIASAREEKYGHPHRQVILRLQNHRIPLLRTEDWGHLHFQEP